MWLWAIRVSSGTTMPYLYLVVSVTSPGAQKSLYIDLGLSSRVAGKRAVVVDDVINTGGTAVAAI